MFTRSGTQGLKLILHFSSKNLQIKPSFSLWSKTYKPALSTKLSCCNLLPASPLKVVTIRHFSDNATIFDDKNDAVESQGSPLSDEDLKTLAGDDEELKKKVKLIEFEYLVYQQEGTRVPSKLKLADWRQLMEKPSKTSRQKLFTFLWLREIKKINEKEKKEKKKEENRLLREQAKAEEVDDGHIKYGLWNNTIFLKLLDPTMHHFYHSKIVTEMRLENPVVFDLGHESKLSVREQQNVASQLTYMFAENREHPQPFHLYFCNTNFKGKTYERLLSQIPVLNEPDFPLHVTEKSYLDLFPKEKLIYLTPHCQTEMTDFDSDAIYIIGGIVDLSCGEPISLAKAKREGLKMAKFPLDRYLHWGTSGKSLTLNQCVNILRELRYTKGDWERALQFVPRRKLKTTEQVQEEILAQRMKRRGPRTPAPFRKTFEEEKPYKSSKKSVKLDNLLFNDLKR